VFALALADIHGMVLDQDQSHALIYGLSNGRVSGQQIAAMAADVAELAPTGVMAVSRDISSGRGDWSHWANTLADALPAGAAQSLVRTIQTGELDTVREGLSSKQQSAIEYGVGALVGGVTRFVFGREVVEASREAFGEPPATFPPHLELSENVEEDECDDGLHGGLNAMKESARATGDWIAGTATRVGSGVAKGAAAAGGGVAKIADKASRPFRSVDIDGDGIPDEARALTAVKGVGGAVAGVAGAAGSGVAKVFRIRGRGKSGEETAADGVSGSEALQD